MRFAPAVMPPWTLGYQRFWTKRQKRVTACRGRASGSGGCGKFIAGHSPFARRQPPIRTVLNAKSPTPCDAGQLSLYQILPKMQ